MRKNILELGTLICPARVQRCSDGDYPVLSMTMHNGLVFQNDKFKKSIASQDKTDYKVVYRNQLVIGFPIDEGVLATQRITDAGIVSPAYGIWDVDKEKILPEYLELGLRCNRALEYYRAKLRGSTARRRSLPTPTLLEFRLPVPSIQEQQGILDVIHRAQSVVDARREQLSELGTLIKARFVEMFGDAEINPLKWEKIRVGDIIECIEAGWSGNGKQRKHKPGEIAVLKVSAVTKGYFIPEECKVLDDQDNIKKYVYPHKGDLLFSRANTREMVGATAIITEDYPELLLPDKLWRIRFASDANVVYMKFVLSSKSIREQFSAASTGTSGSMFNVSMSKFEAITIPLPPLMLQNHFAAFVAQVDKSKVAIQKALDEAQTLFDSLMQEYFQ